MATGGLDVYDSLWGPGIQHANYCINRSVWSDGRVPYESLTGLKSDLPTDPKLIYTFGQQVFFHKSSEQRPTQWDTPGSESVWVGYSDKISGGHKVVPIAWDPVTTRA